MLASPLAAAAGLAIIGLGTASWDAASIVEAAAWGAVGRHIMPRLHGAFSLGTVAGAGPIPVIRPGAQDAPLDNKRKIAQAWRDRRTRSWALWSLASRWPKERREIGCAGPRGRTPPVGCGWSRRVRHFRHLHDHRPFVGCRFQFRRDGDEDAISRRLPALVGEDAAEEPVTACNHQQEADDADDGELCDDSYDDYCKAGHSA